jgi:MFS family permease
LIPCDNVQPSRPSHDPVTRTHFSRFPFLFWRDLWEMARRDVSAAPSPGSRSPPSDDSHMPLPVAAAGDRPPPCYVPRRAITAVFLFLGLAVVYALRVCISIAAVPGTPTNATAGSAAAIVTMYSEFGWSNTDQGIVLGAFFNGYIFTQVLGGMLSRCYGGKLVLIGCVALASFFTAMTPPAAEASFSLLVACRTCLGAVEGVSFPAVMSMLVEWAAPAERSIAVGFVFAGAYIGNVGTFLISGWILEAFGWRWIFYSLASVGLVWCLLFAVMTSPSPTRALKRSLLRIHPSELALLSCPRNAEPASTGGQQQGDTDGQQQGDTDNVNTADGSESASDDVEEPFLRRGGEGVEDHVDGGGGEGRSRRGGGGSNFAVPWGKIARSRACWAIFAGHTTFNFSFYLLLTQLPSYLRLVAGMSGEEAASASALPYLLMLVMSITGGVVADTLIASRTLSNASTRRLMTGTGLVGSGVCLLAAGFSAPATPPQPGAPTWELPPSAVLFVTAGLGIAAVANSGYNANYLEVGGRFSGVLLSLGNTLATLPGILAPVLTGMIVDSYGCSSGAAATGEK